ncbi:MAG: hypothetical protein ACJA15_000979 [Flavobacteriales bacterium]|jgi:hypothetical protein
MLIFAVIKIVDYQIISSFRKVFKGTPSEGRRVGEIHLFAPSVPYFNGKRGDVFN